MSLILDALRRSERSETTAVSIASAEPADLGNPRRSSALLIVLCCLLLGVLAGWLIRGGTGESMQASIDSPTAPASASHATPPPVSDGKPSISASSNLAKGSTQLEDKSRALGGNSPPTAGPDVGASAVANPMAGDPANKAEAKQPSVAALNSQMWTDADVDSRTNLTDSRPESTGEVATSNSDIGAEPRTSIAPPIDLAAAIERAAREVGEPSLLPHPAVLLENLSQQQKDQVPTIVYSAHDFTGAGRPSVTLNQRQLGEGQRVGSIAVIEILPDSVILKINGVVFRLRALNTWVNL